MDLEQLALLARQLCSVDAKLRSICKEKPSVSLLSTIKGVSPVAAQTIAVWIDDPSRFKSSRQVSAYAGLVPRRYQSGKVDRSGRISKRGPKWLRTALVESYGL
ncbi:MAG: IS110 family transposase [Planctomycetota bacterium]